MKIFLKTLVFGLMFGGVLFLRGPVVQAVDCNSPDITVKDSITCGTDSTGGQAPGTDPGNTLSETVASIINKASIIIGAIAVVMIIVAGARFVASAGSETGIKAAKSSLAYALIGLVLVVVAQLIVHFVLYNLSDSKTQQPASNTTTSGPTPI